MRSRYSSPLCSSHSLLNGAHSTQSKSLQCRFTVYNLKLITSRIDRHENSSVHLVCTAETCFDEIHFPTNFWRAKFRNCKSFTTSHFEISKSHFWQLRSSLYILPLQNNASDGRSNKTVYCSGGLGHFRNTYELKSSMQKQNNPLPTIYKHYFIALFASIFSLLCRPALFLTFTTEFNSIWQ